MSNARQRSSLLGRPARTTSQHYALLDQLNPDGTKNGSSVTFQEDTFSPDIKPAASTVYSHVSYADHVPLTQKWKSFWIRTAHDLRTFPWALFGRRCLTYLLPLVLFAGLFALILLMALLPVIFVAEDDGGCTPDGDFELSLSPFDYTPWTSSSWFAVNVKFGSYPFEVVKLIDVIWDVV